MSPLADVLVGFSVTKAVKQDAMDRIAEAEDSDVHSGDQVSTNGRFLNCRLFSMVRAFGVPAHVLRSMRSRFCGWTTGSPTQVGGCPCPPTSL